MVVFQKLEGKTTTLKNWIKRMEGNSTTPKNCVLTKNFAWKEYNFPSGFLTNTILNFAQECLLSFFSALLLCLLSFFLYQSLQQRHSFVCRYFHSTYMKTSKDTTYSFQVKSKSKVIILNDFLSCPKAVSSLKCGFLKKSFIMNAPLWVGCNTANPPKNDDWDS